MRSLLYPIPYVSICVMDTGRKLYNYYMYTHVHVLITNLTPEGGSNLTPEGGSKVITRNNCSCVEGSLWTRLLVYSFKVHLLVPLDTHIYIYMYNIVHVT